MLRGAGYQLPGPEFRSVCKQSGLPDVLPGNRYPATLKENLYLPQHFQDPLAGGVQLVLHRLFAEL
jgi:hypothetical protein